MKFAALHKQTAVFTSAALMLLLSGCKEQVVLHDAAGKIVGNGVLQVTALFPSPVHLSLGGKEYSGNWDRENIYEADVAKARRKLGERAYMSYIEGNDPAQLRHGQANLLSSDGSEMHCDFYYRDKPDQGNCDLDGKQLTFMVL
ncbi:MAG: hypothetical protein WA632_10170 [Gallionella sp.]